MQIFEGSSRTDACSFTVERDSEGFIMLWLETEDGEASVTLSHEEGARLLKALAQE